MWQYNAYTVFDFIETLRFKIPRIISRVVGFKNAFVNSVCVPNSYRLKQLLDRILVADKCH